MHKGGGFITEKARVSLEWVGASYKLAHRGLIVMAFANGSSHMIHEHRWYPSSVWSAGFLGGDSDHRLWVEACINRFRITTDVPVVSSLSGNRRVTYTQSGGEPSVRTKQARVGCMDVSPSGLIVGNRRANYPGPGPDTYR